MNVETFLTRWTGREGGAERANYVMFLTELCDIIGVQKPEPAGATRDYNDYVFERAVRPRESAETSAPLRIDLYKRGCFVLEASQPSPPFLIVCDVGHCLELYADFSGTGTSFH